MTSPLLVVVQGAPGSGKTTLLRRLKKDFTLPMLGKDDIKELLFEQLTQSDQTFSRLQGRASFEMLYTFAKTFLDAGNSVLIEGAFFTDISRASIAEITKNTGVRTLELFCHTDEATRRQRFIARSQDGTRHLAHRDHNHEVIPESSIYVPLKLGASITIDTTAEISDELYNKIVVTIQQALDGDTS